MYPIKPTLSISTITKCLKPFYGQVTQRYGEIKIKRDSSLKWLQLKYLTFVNLRKTSNHVNTLLWSSRSWKRAKTVKSPENLGVNMPLHLMHTKDMQYTLIMKFNNILKILIIFEPPTIQPTNTSNLHLPVCFHIPCPLLLFLIPR